jgi:hypothetical protein
VKADEIGRVCSINGGEENACRLLWDSQKERDHYEDENVGGWIILRWILER